MAAAEADVESRAAVASGSGPRVLVAFDGVKWPANERDLFGRITWTGIFADGFHTGDSSNWSSTTP
jgi:hypothetical protein